MNDSQALEERWVTIGQTRNGLTLTVANLFFNTRTAKESCD